MSHITKEDTTSTAVAPSSTAMSVLKKPREQGKTWKLFNVSSETFSKFSTGRNKFERWSRFLNLEDEGDSAIYDYARTKRENTIVLRCSDTGALRSIRRRSSCGV